MARSLTLSPPLPRTGSVSFVSVALFRLDSERARERRGGGLTLSGGSNIYPCTFESRFYASVPRLDVGASTGVREGPEEPTDGRRRLRGGRRAGSRGVPSWGVYVTEGGSKVEELGLGGVVPEGEGVESPTWSQ